MSFDDFQTWQHLLNQFLDLSRQHPEDDVLADELWRLLKTANWQKTCRPLETVRAAYAHAERAPSLLAGALDEFFLYPGLAAASQGEFEHILKADVPGLGCSPANSPQLVRWGNERVLWP